MTREPALENRDGRWLPSCPEPLWVGFRLRVARCECGEKFKPRWDARGRYRSHWYASHDPARVIQGLS